ncbi:hypothetical protein BDV41DRAFT_28987 [Aspergillus transmontanensis]|uniref:Uncharacterized protein n=1 Tax=Aspergillus transmontanensis TaxID=1034304 RepID=A0A5N6VHP6_9EURO|nr:hypothetical protein BDV41DRAFT_28987 [Aspergillus transmontanensis]
MIYESPSTILLFSILSFMEAVYNSFHGNYLRKYVSRAIVYYIYVRVHTTYPYKIYIIINARRHKVATISTGTRHIHIH